MVRWKPRGFCQTRLHCLALTLADTGARIGEAIGLCWPDVDLDNLLLRLHGKGGKDRLVPFSLELRRHLWKWRKLNYHGIVFPTAQGGPIAHRNTLRDVRGNSAGGWALKRPLVCCTLSATVSRPTTYAAAEVSFTCRSVWGTVRSR